jgi:hypothetical protein
MVWAELQNAPRSTCVSSLNFREFLVASIEVLDRIGGAFSASKVATKLTLNGARVHAHF